MDNSLYFSHDYTASDDVKMLYLRQAHGFEGIGLFWATIERLAQSGGKLPLAFIPVLSMQFQIDATKLTSVIKDFNLFQIEDDHFSSRRLMDHINLRKQLKDAGAKGAAKRWGNDGKQTKIKLD